MKQELLSSTLARVGIMSIVYLVVGFLFGIVSLWVLVPFFIGMLGMVLVSVKASTTSEEYKKLGIFPKLVFHIGDFLSLFIFGIWIDMVVLNGFYGLYKAVFVDFSIKFILLSLFFLFIGRKYSIHLNNFHNLSKQSA